jgi:glutathione peroxidase
LINADGSPIKRYAPFTKPEKLEKVIEKALLAAKV